MCGRRELFSSLQRSRGWSSVAGIGRITHACCGSLQIVALLAFALLSASVFLQPCRPCLVGWTAFQNKTTHLLLLLRSSARALTLEPGFEVGKHRDLYAYRANWADGRFATNHDGEFDHNDGSQFAFAECARLGLRHGTDVENAELKISFQLGGVRIQHCVHDPVSLRLVVDELASVRPVACGRGGLASCLVSRSIAAAAQVGTFIIAIITNPSTYFTHHRCLRNPKV